MSYNDDRSVAGAPDPLTNIDAEAALLGSMLIDNRIVTEWADRLAIDDFAEPLHGRIFSAVLRFASAGKKATAISLKPIFARDEDALGGEYLARLVETPAALVGASEFAEQIIALSDRRVARAAILQAQEQIVADLDMPIMEITGRVETAGWAASTRATAKPVRTMGDAVRMSRERAQRVESGEEIGIKNLLIPDLDKILGPLETGYYIIAGRPGMGKTTLALTGAQGYSIGGAPGVYCSAEMTEEQLALRATSDLSFAMGKPIKHDDLRRGKLTPKQFNDLDAIEARADLLPLRTVDLRGANIRRVWSEAARQKALWAAHGKKLRFVVVDSIALFQADIDGKLIDDDRKRVNFISTFLNQMAHALDVAVIALNQLSRGVEARQNKRPLLSDLKESGNLEQDADAVLFIYREEYYLEQTKPKPGEREGRGGPDLLEEWEVAMNIARGKAELISAKNRHGRNQSRTVNFFGEYYAIREATVVDDAFQDPLLF